MTADKKTLHFLLLKLEHSDILELYIFNDEQPPPLVEFKILLFSLWCIV